ncbi:MAG: HD domain-containing protein [Bradymonadia bacterium]
MHIDDITALHTRLIEALALKAIPRAGWPRVGVPEHQTESVAAHSWGVAWLVIALCPSDVDRGRALAIAVLHDLAEARVGDITPHDNVPKVEKHRLEHAAFVDLVSALPQRDELIALWMEYESQSSAEGRFVKACDKLDMALQAQLYARDHDADTSELVQAALAKLTDPLLNALAGR